MRIKAYAKINLSLDIVEKRDDGYHLLEMIMQTIDIYDEITIEKQNKDITIKCNKSYVPTNEKNLAYKAAKLFMEEYGIKGGVNIYIKKNIPVCAGLAGGSTDGAAVLKIMNRLFNVNASTKELMEIGLKLGADVPYCINGGTALCKGIGEEITELKNFKDKILVVVKPPFGVSTKSVYQEFNIEKAKSHPDTYNIIKYIEEDNLKLVCDNMKNLLENITLKKYKSLIRIKEEMRYLGALGSMMSGSGPTIFAFFDDMQKAQRCFEKMKESYCDVFITRTI
ncbi:4-(cytidine 5'-diphospho)-2-C-methyl-D-erythritol kinase [Clostridium sp.]|uniref:4-(cytidine 5'-diphospho)-2-C-methyl-D-erythritol kinase n=1 Tax=Clostridium sp. TaxID=1506 RepID=UPI00261A1465|nr:4-(cytidine 5'-diphospho)-2-C-methyl-D-erythritol kinase [Clostridium sp.]